MARATPYLKGATPSGHSFSHPHQAMSGPVGALDTRDASTAAIVENFGGVADGDAGGCRRAAV